MSRVSRREYQWKLVLALFASIMLLVLIGQAVVDRRSKLKPLRANGRRPSSDDVCVANDILPSVLKYRLNRID